MTGGAGHRSRLARLVLAASQFANARGLYLGRHSTRVHVALYRWSGGRVGGHVPGWPRARILLLDHVGARTGRRRTSPVIYHEHGGWVAIAASKAGQPTSPAWLYNLRANPATAVQIGREIREVRARVAGDEERERLWPEFVARYPAYDFYARNAGARTIPIVILEPR